MPSADASHAAHKTMPHHIALRFIPAAAAPLDACRALVQHNMTPYLAKRGECFDKAAWDRLATEGELIHIFAENTFIGFVMLRHDQDSHALHISDLQLEAAARGQGIGSAALAHIETLARARGLHEITLHVFRENPAIGLYERHGFRIIDHGFDRLKMKRKLPARNE